MTKTAKPTPGEPWYREGLSFSCTRCGHCCGGAPGFVWVDDAEIARLAARLDLPVGVFRARYTRRVRGLGTSLVETDDHDCVFYRHEQGCTVYEDRPRQCRTWPFWGKVVASAVTWEIECRDCPGMNQGRRFTAEEIHAFADDDGLPKPKT